jgi:hypothetical protein
MVSLYLLVASCRFRLRAFVNGEVEQRSIPNVSLFYRCRSTLNPYRPTFKDQVLQLARTRSHAKSKLEETLPQSRVGAFSLAPLRLTSFASEQGTRSARAKSYKLLFRLPTKGEGELTNSSADPLSQTLRLAVAINTWSDISTVNEYQN